MSWTWKGVINVSIEILTMKEGYELCFLEQIICGSKFKGTKVMGCLKGIERSRGRRGYIGDCTRRRRGGVVGRRRWVASQRWWLRHGGIIFCHGSYLLIPYGNIILKKKSIYLLIDNCHVQYVQYI